MPISHVYIVVCAYGSTVGWDIDFVIFYVPFVVLDDTSFCAYGITVGWDIDLILLDLELGIFDIISISVCFLPVLVYLPFVIVDTIWVG